MTGLQDKSIARLNRIIKILNEYKTPMTVRQIFYQFVVRAWEDNNLSAYRAIQRMIRIGREKGQIPWSRIVDRTRRPIRYSGWSSMEDFAEAAAVSYRKNLWDDNEAYVEIWLEKQALEGFFDLTTRKWQVSLQVTRGYPSASFLWETVQFLTQETRPIYVYYFGDFDPSGVDIERKVRRALGEKRARVQFSREAILKEDIHLYNLPTQRVKDDDTRTRGFRARHGDRCVELDALPPDVLRQRIEGCITRHVDIERWEALRRVEEAERETIRKVLRNLAAPGIV